MNPKTFLDQPLKVIAPTGYPACLNCGKYFHHPIVYCPSCGKKIVAWTEISIGDFIEKTANHGTGPLFTLYVYLKNIQGVGLFDDFTPKNRAIYNYAKKIHKRAQKK